MARHVLYAAVDIANQGSLRVLAKLGFQFDEHRVFGGPKRLLGGDWRPNEVLFFTKQLYCFELDTKSLDLRSVTRSRPT